jgi:hypothetical protein
VIEEDDLGVLARLQLYPGGVVTRRHVWVQVDNLTVALVLEEQPLGIVGDDLVKMMIITRI